MGNPEEPKPVKYFAALLSAHKELLFSVRDDLRVLLGAVDSSSLILPWTITKYYEKEMGVGLLRCFVSFFPLASPEKLSQIKLRTQEMEEKYGWIHEKTKGRRINIDPGYVDAGKVVLASTKSASHRLYLGSGIYGEATLFYQDDSFHSFSYTYADYLWPETLSFFTGLRSLYLDQLRRRGSGVTGAV